LNTDEAESVGTPIDVENSSALLLGLGLEYALYKQLSLRAEYISFQEDIDYAQLGLVYRFGKPGEIAAQKQPVESIAQPNDISQESSLALETLKPAAPVVTQPKDLIAENVSQCGTVAAGLEPVTFAFDSARISRAEEQKLEKTAQTLVNCGTETVIVQGHTDSVGSLSYNQNLSKKRAVSVIQFLESKGMRAEQLSEESFGEQRPLQSNETVGGRAANRRVELFVN